MRFSILALATSLGAAVAQYKGFNYGSTSPSGAAYTQQDFEQLFTNAANLQGASGFTSARLFTMIQAGSTTNQPISAIPAAISTKTTLLLGLWASAGDAGFASEIAALTQAIQTYPSFASQIAGISVGSEDLYRISPEAAAQGNVDPGAQPATIVNYIQQVRNAIAGTAWSAAKVGHVDTWTVWADAAIGDSVATASDFVGVDAYPYYQNTSPGGNAVSSGPALFQTALNSLTAIAKSKEVWITETGWPTTGATIGEGVPGVAQAQQYWQDVGCGLLFGKYNTWWFQFTDVGATPSFGVSSGGTTPLYDLACSVSSSTTTLSSTTTSVSTTSSGVSSTILASTSSVAAASTTSASTVAVTTTSSPSSSAPSVSTTSSAPIVSTPAITSSDVYVATTAVYETDYTTVTSCPPGQSSFITKTVVATSASTLTVSPAVAPSSTVKACPVDLNGQYEYPHLIVPISSASPDTAYGTSYNGTISPAVSTIFNFDIPASYVGKTCSLIFLFPLQSQLETSAYTFNGQGGLSCSVLSGIATESTMFANAPAAALNNGAIASLESGHSYLISSDSCPAGQRVSFKLVSTGGLALEYFQDYNPSPLGLYVRSC